MTNQEVRIAQSEDHFEVFARDGVTLIGREYGFRVYRVLTDETLGYITHSRKGGWYAYTAKGQSAGGFMTRKDALAAIVRILEGQPR